MKNGRKSKRKGVAAAIRENEERTAEEAERKRENTRQILADRRNSRTRLGLQRAVKHLEDRVEQLEDQNERLQDLTSYKPKKFRIPKRTRKETASGLNRVVPIICASDWHMGEAVRPETVNGLNEYTPEIAQERARKFFQSAHELIDINRAGALISTVCLWAGGDFITGRLHADADANHLSPIEETHLCFDTLISGIDYWLDRADIAKLLIVTNHGNHGRTSAKEYRVATSAENSFEFSLYHQLRRHYELLAKVGRLEKGRVEFRIAEGNINWLELENDIAVRTTHGDGFNFAGGIGGLYIPLNKAIHRWNTYPTTERPIPRPATYDILGHWHQYTPGAFALVNGSLIGVSPYAMKVGHFEEAQQAYCQVDLDTKSARKIGAHFPIRVT